MGRPLLDSQLAGIFVDPLLAFPPPNTPLLIVTGAVALEHARDPSNSGDGPSNHSSASGAWQQGLYCMAPHSSVLSFSVLQTPQCNAQLLS